MSLLRIFYFIAVVVGSPAGCEKREGDVAGLDTYENLAKNSKLLSTIDGIRLPFEFRVAEQADVHALSEIFPVCSRLLPRKRFSPTRFANVFQYVRNVKSEYKIFMLVEAEGKHRGRLEGIAILQRDDDKTNYLSWIMINEDPTQKIFQRFMQGCFAASKKYYPNEKLSVRKIARPVNFGAIVYLNAAKSAGYKFACIGHELCAVLPLEDSMFLDRGLFYFWLNWETLAQGFDMDFVTEQPQASSQVFVFDGRDTHIIDIVVKSGRTLRREDYQSQLQPILQPKEAVLVQIEKDTRYRLEWLDFSYGMEQGDWSTFLETIFSNLKQNGASDVVFDASMFEKGGLSKKTAKKMAKKGGYVAGKNSKGDLRFKLPSSEDRSISSHKFIRGLSKFPRN